MNDQDPHYARKEAILAAYPGVRELFGPDLRTLWYVAAVVAVQAGLAAAVAHAGAAALPAAVVGGLLVGPFLDAGVLVIMHELSHNRCTGSILWDRLISIAANAVMLAPIRCGARAGRRRRARASPSIHPPRPISFFAPRAVRYSGSTTRSTTCTWATRSTTSTCRARWRWPGWARRPRARPPG